MHLRPEQIADLPLSERQKLLLELNNTKPQTELGEKHLAATKTAILASPGFVEAELFEAEARLDGALEGVRFRRGETLKLFRWQYEALARFFYLAPESQARYCALCDDERSKRIASMLRD